MARQHPTQVYNALFEAVSQTLSLLARDVLGARLGLTAVLHTWTRRLGFHPDVHCVVTAGVTFRTHGDDTATLAPNLFISRFLQHVLPSGFHKIRHYGLYASANVHRLWPKAAALLGPGDGLDEQAASAIATADAVTLLGLLTGTDVLHCKRCDVGHMRPQPLPPKMEKPP